MSSGSKNDRFWLDPNLAAVEAAPPVKPKNFPGVEEITFNAAEERKQLTADEEDIALLTVDEALFLSFSWVGELMHWLLLLATGGLYWLVTRWVRGLEAAVRYRRVASPDPAADYVLAYSIDRFEEICPIRSIDPRTGTPEWVPVSRARSAAAASSASPSAFPFPRMFEWRHERFWFDTAAGKWVRLQFAVNQASHRLHDMAATLAFRNWDAMKAAQTGAAAPLGDLYKGDLSWDDYTRDLTYGINIIDIKPKPFIVLIKDEALKPFFVFQIFSLIVWYFQAYYLYTGIVFMFTIISLCSTSFVTWRNQHSLQRIAKSEVPVTKLFLSNKQSTEVISPEVLHRNGRSKGTERTRPWAPVPTFHREVISSAKLHPGDLIEITNGTTIPCDMILLSGSVVINEAMLTGESAPVQKTSIPYHHGDGPSTDQSSWFRLGSDRDAKYVLYSGTKVVQAKPQPAAICNPIAERQQSSDQYTYKNPQTIWQFSMDQAAASYSEHLKTTDISEADIEKRVQVFLDSFKNREKSLPIIGMVIKTGFNTAKGKLIRAILYPKPSNFDFDKQMVKFMIILIAATLAGCLATVGFYEDQGASGLDTLLSCLNIVTVAIPPALPLALSVALTTTFSELQLKKIFCINPNRIVPAGRVNTLCFDKTGTLTEDGLTLKSVHTLAASDEHDVPHDGNPKSKSMMLHTTLSQPETDLVTLYQKVSTSEQKTRLFTNKTYMTRDGIIAPCRLGMAYVVAACHSLAVLEEDDLNDDDISVDMEKEGKKKPEKEPTGEYKEQFVGDPLEIQMFAQSGWRFDTRSSINKKRGMFGSQVWDDTNLPSATEVVMVPPQVAGADEALAIIRRFDFDSTLRRMSSVVYHSPIEKQRRDDIYFSTLVKGAPESLRELCYEFSIPADYDQVLHNLTMEGYRVLACAYRPFTAREVIGPDASSSITQQELMEATRKYVSSSRRDEMEKDLYFAGFIVMENSLKKPTLRYLEEFIRAGLRCIMVTGDNPMTAAAVAKQCDPFFLRPSRRTVLLDQIKEPGQEGKLVIRDLLKPEVSTNFFAFLRNRKDHANIKLTGAKEVDLVDDYAGTIPAELSTELDIVVTGAAFQKLQMIHEEYIKEQQENARKNGEKFNRNAGIHLTPYHLVLTRANIFARMSPQNKQELMTSLQDISLVVAMTGDGANDSGALKSADVGLSIRANDNEIEDASNSAPTIAAPFSTSYSHIGALSILLTEGRACLVSSFSMFRFMFSYGVIQFTSVLILYRLVLELHNNQYLWSDLFLVFPLAVVMPTIKAKPTLSRGRPESDLFSPSILRSVIGLGAIIAIFQVGANEYFRTTSDFIVPDDDTDTTNNPDTSQSYVFSSFQYTAVGVAVSQSYGVFRQPLYHAYLLCLVFLAQFGMNSAMLLGPNDDIKDYFKIIPPAWEVRIKLFVLAIANSIVFVLYERFCVPHQSPDEEPFDVDAVVKEIRPREHSDTVPREHDKADFQPTFLPKLRWAVPQYTIIQSVASPIWSALAQPS